MFSNSFFSNLVLSADSYKFSHFLQYPEGTTSTFAYLESRGGKYEKTLFFGLQYVLKNYFSDPITPAMVEEAACFFNKHGLDFNYEGWLYIAKDLKGKLPLKIRAVAEGSVGEPVR